MKKHRILLIGFCFSVCTMALAQIANVPGVGNEVLRVKKYENVEGSPYLYNDWKSGTVTDSKGAVYTDVLLKFDAYKDVVEINQEGNVLLLNSFLYPKFSISFMEPGTNKKIRHDFIGGIAIPGIGKAYVEILQPGNVMAAKKIEIKFIDEEVKSYGTAASTKRFQRSEKYYIVRNNEAAEVKLNNKSVLAAINDKLPELELYLKTSKIKNENDLAALVAYYNSL